MRGSDGNAAIHFAEDNRMQSQYRHVNAWIEDCAAYLQPNQIVWVDGSEEETKRFNDLLVKQGVFTPLDEKSYPNSFWSRSDKSDVARVEARTFICSRSEEDAGPTNNWGEPGEMYARLRKLMTGAMKGRTMYVIPYLMGPDGSPYSRVGFELTDSPYVVQNMRIMARIGEVALKNLDPTSKSFVRGIHSKGTLDIEQRYICHFPEDATIISFNSDYGGNALQGKKCFALRIASALARRDGWLAEHMLILGITDPQGRKTYITAAFPSACGKTNLAMLVPPESYLKSGWKVETIGDDIAWLNFGPDGRLYAINPEAGFFGVAPGTSKWTNPNAIGTVKKNAIFTNTAFDPVTRLPWWEGLGDPPAKLIDWLGEEWTPAKGTKAAHPNSRFTVPAKQCPSISPDWESPQGVPISAIIFGGRQASTNPLVYEAFNWNHGVYLGAMLSSETTAAAAGAVGELRRDPMAMRPFIGYHAADYFRHWLECGKRNTARLPKIFRVNWFRKGGDGKYLWPGFGDNMRVLEWIVGRVYSEAEANETPIGFQPDPATINLEGLNFDQAQLKELFAVKIDEWKKEAASQREYLKEFGSKLPKEISDEVDTLARRLGSV